MNIDRAMTVEEAGRLLFSAAFKGIDYLVDSLLPKIAEALNLNYVDCDQNKIRNESLGVCLWAATKALEGESPELIESIHQAALLDIEGKKRSGMNELLLRRIDQYNKAWNVKSDDTHSILCINILAEMFTKGNHQRELVNYWAFIQTANFVSSLMKAIVDLRRGIKIEE